MKRVMRAGFLVFVFALFLLPQRTLAGPPFDTDDPAPTEYRNYEIYAGMTLHRDYFVSNSELPFLEINYGLMPNVQFSVHVGRAVDAAPGSPHAAGFQDFEAGLKVRFIQETATSPQVSLYPQVTFASGVAGVTADHGTFFLPLWAQKTVGKITVFGGGGFDFDRDASGPGDWQGGLAATDPVTPSDTVGLEVTRTTPHAAYQQSDIGIGYIRQAGAVHGLLISFGRSIGLQPHYRGYAAYGWFLGPAEKKP